MDPFVIAFWAVLIAAIVFFWWYSREAVPADQVNIVKGSRDGGVESSVSVRLPLSFNQPEGLIYSYSGWVLVKDFGTGYGQRRTIFKTGDDSPALYIDSTSNSFIVAVKTFGATETVMIPSVPAMKWIHIALVVDQQALDVYINGTLRQHHTLGQLPRQSDTPTVVLGGGWSGVLADLVYYSRALLPSEIRRRAQGPAPDSLQRQPALPQYFDISWYIGRFYSK